MATTAALCPPALIASASAAASVVLPAPGAPATATMTRELPRALRKMVAAMLAISDMAASLDPGSTEKRRIVGNEQAQRLGILLDVRETADRLGEDVVGEIIVDGRDFADQHVGAFRPELVPDAGKQRDAFTRSEAQRLARTKAAHETVARHGHRSRVVD